MATGKALVQKACEQLKSTLTKADAVMFSDASLAEIWKEALQIEKEQGARRDLRYMRRIEPYLRSLEDYAGVLEVFCQGYQPMAFVWGPIKLMLKLARNYTAVMDTILEAFNEIAEVLPRLDRLRATFQDNTDLNRMVGLIFSDLIEFHQRAYKFFRCKGWHILFAVNWGLFEKRFKSIIHRLSSHCDLLDREAAAIHFSEMKDFRAKRLLEDEAFERHRHVQMTESVFQWLSTVANEDAQAEYLDRTSDSLLFGTCDWILADSQMEAWIENRVGDPILWVTGIPGAGKSFLCTFIVRNLRTRPDESCLYYFFGRKKIGGDTCAGVLCTLVVQILRQNPHVVPLIYHSFLQKTSRTESVMKKMLFELLPVVKVLHVIIDGVDEASHEIQKEIVRSLRELQKQAGENFRLLISSRKEPQIQSTLLAKSHLELGANTSKGLDLFIAAKTQDVKERFPDMDTKLERQVTERLHDKAQGMFLWVRLVVATLVQQSSEAEVEKAIDRLPEGLNEAYGLILERIASWGSATRARAFRVLFWLCTAYRPLAIEEAADGIVLQSSQRELSKRTKSNNLQRDLVEVCAPLLEVSSAGTLDLVHFSAKEYLIDKQSGPFIDIAEAHLSVAVSCVINLISSLDLIPRPCNPVTESELQTRVMKGHFGLHSYGHDYWAEHTIACLASMSDVDPKARQLISILEEFSHVSKHRMAAPYAFPDKYPISDNLREGLRKLEQHPSIHNLIVAWYLFKWHLQNENNNTPEMEQQWKLRTDETYLSLIDLRLSRITEDILLMKSSELPPHIDKTCFEIFIKRYKLLCRFSNCSHHFDCPADRDLHEATHAPSYPCMQCDFIERGFKTRKDLDRHTQKYHMRPDDFEIPINLHAASTCSNGDRVAVYSRASGCWNEQGRNALQRGFRHVLAKVESQLASNKNITLTRKCMASVDNIRDKIETEGYEYLSDFKEDLQNLASIPENLQIKFGDQGIQSLCAEEFERATSQYSSFTNLKHNRYDLEEMRSSIRTHYTATGYAESASACDEHLSPSKQFSLTERAPYWSVPEAKEFPVLLREYGRKFVSIADCLKTKTPAEVESYFLNLVACGNSDLAEVANLADATIESDRHTAESASQNDSQTSGVDAPISDSALETQQMQQDFDPIPPYFPRLENLHPTNRSRIPEGAATRQSKSLERGSEPNEGAKTKKRKPRPRACCPHCNKELHDEYAVRRHIIRLHTATRRVWICEDIAIDKNFLTQCKSCSAGKRYKSQLHAAKHLRETHFPPDTPDITLHRWMQEMEEPNPNFEVSTAENGSQFQRSVKRQKTEAKSIFLPPVNFDPGSLKTDRLPSVVLRSDQIQTESENPDNRSPALSSGDLNVPTEDRSTSSAPENAASKEMDALADVTWDNILPRSNDYPSPRHDSYDHRAPHRADGTLIQPHQVPRLPHLDSFRKIVCQDQVDALHYRLDKGRSSYRYDQELENLRTLSRTLMSNLRDWRRHSHNAPDIPFSL